MILLVESGATKGDWRVISKDGTEVRRLTADGTNVSAMKLEAVRGIISNTCGLLAGEQISRIYFYTAGVVTEVIANQITTTLQSVFPDAVCDIQDDLTAAARAACGHRAGIAAILGTGSNSCLFDGEKIIQRVYSGGYILGDEGSAATLGKLFISDFLKGIVPEKIAKDFTSRYDCSYATIVEKVYRSKESPSGYLGSFAPFIMEHYDDAYIRELVDGNFRSFIRRSLIQYDTESYHVGVVGGFGYALKDIFEKVAMEEGVKVTGFIKSPIDGLIKYHLEK
jgi:N-acetylglucosamine kinase-like BadF-type ATPase